MSIIRIHVILSVPIPSSVFGARILASIFATTLDAFVLLDLSTTILSFSIPSPNYEHASSLVRQSQIPSQAKIMNLSLFVLLCSLISGEQVTA